MIIFNDTLGVYGGSQTLMLRMCQWLSQNKIPAVVICRSAANDEIVEKLRDCGTRIIPMDIRDAKKTGQLLRELQSQEDLCVVNFIWNYYLDMERVKTVAGLRFENIIYAIHPDTFKKGLRIRNPLLHEYAIRSYRRILQRMNDHGAVWMMDQDVLSATEAYLGIQLSPTPPIHALPMFCRENPQAQEIIRDGFQSQTLMTASRAEFPFKGYLLGLLDEFPRLKARYPELRLQMVAGGLEEDVEKIHAKIQALPEECRRSVDFHNWMDYDQLRQEMTRCRLFIGMGTSVLDAALAYKPSIPVRYHTYEVNAEHLFSEAPRELSARHSCTVSAVQVIQRVLEAPFETYRAMCQDSFDRCREVYDMAPFMQELIALSSQRQGSLLTWKERTRHHLNNRVNQILRREQDPFDIQKIKTE